jgi:hypothetical protein
MTIGVIAARASAPEDLIVPDSLDTKAADALAKGDAAAIGIGIERYYQQTLMGGIPAPPVTVADGNYILGPVENGPNTWEWPPIPVSDGVTFEGQTDDGYGDWCVWVSASNGDVKDWQVTEEGVIEGTCGLG